MLLEFPFGGNSNSNPNSNLVPPCYFRYQKLIWTRLFSVGKEGGGGRRSCLATVSREEELSEMEKKHSSPIKEFFMVAQLVA